MLIRELYNLSPQERDIIFTWRIIHAPRVLNCAEIQKYLPYTAEQISQAIKTFNRNMRAKLEADSIHNNLKKLIEYYFTTEDE